MRKFYILGLLLFVASCASVPESTSLYTVYSEYKASANQENILTTYPQYYSPRLVAGDKPDESAIPFLLFKDKMIQEGSHFEAMVGDNVGCLTVEGLDDEAGDPIEFNIRYILVKEQWLIDGTNVRFLDSADQYSKTAKCP